MAAVCDDVGNFFSEEIKKRATRRSLCFIPNVTRLSSLFRVLANLIDSQAGIAHKYVVTL